MKRLDAANDNEAGNQIARTRQVWQSRIGRDLTDEDARQIIHNVTGFFSLLADWSRAEKLVAANDAAAPTVDRLRSTMQAIEDPLLQQAGLKPTAELVPMRGSER